MGLPALERFNRIAVFGGVYSNYIALQTVLEDARIRGAEGLFCLGDIGGFGPHPDRVFPILKEGGVSTVQGNYDHSVGNGLADCQCGYTDPRDNAFAKISYDYTFTNTSDPNKLWLKGLPQSIRIELGGYRVLMCHGSPRRVNEFLWESTTPTHFLEKLSKDNQTDVVLATHTGLHWHRQLERDKHFINVGVIGRPANDGLTGIRYVLMTAGGEDLTVEFVTLNYDHTRLASEMQAEGLPQEFIDTILTGWWTCCLEILPMKERRRGKY